MNNNDEQKSSDNDSLGRAANRYVSFQIWAAIFGGIIFLIVLFAVILPQMNQANRMMNNVNQTFGHGFPQPTGMPMGSDGGNGTTLTVNGHPATPEERKSFDAAFNQSHNLGK